MISVMECSLPMIVEGDFYERVREEGEAAGGEGPQGAGEQVQGGRTPRPGD